MVAKEVEFEIDVTKKAKATRQMKEDEFVALALMAARPEAEWQPSMSRPRKNQRRGDGGVKECDGLLSY
jgi:hypothetical protein